MNARPLGIITTRLPPHTCGIGTYSWLLRESWPEQKRAVKFFVVENGAGSPVEVAVRRSKLRRALNEFGSGDLLLQYAARAYHRLGAPLWLPSALARWKQRFPQARLVVFFHELAGDAPITSPHYWLGAIDHYIARQLVRMADAVATNTEVHAAKLQRFANAKRIEVLPVGSNVPAASATAPRGKGDFVIFGLPFGRLQTLQFFDQAIRDWIASGRLKQLHIIGPADEKFSPDADRLITSWPEPKIATRHGLLPPAQVAPFLQRAEFALTNVSDATWSKSSAFMGYAANRCPVVIRSSRPASGPLSYAISVDEVSSTSETELTRRTVALAQWYEQNATWPVIAERTAALFDS